MAIVVDTPAAHHHQYQKRNRSAKSQRLHTVWLCCPFDTICTYRTNTKHAKRPMQQLKLHLKEEHFNEKLECPILGCDRTFVVKSSLDRHLKNYQSVEHRRKMCRYCPNVQVEHRTMHALQTHITSYHRKGLFRCTECGYTTTADRPYRHAIHLHYIEQHQLGKFRCYYCEKSYKQMSHLNRHLHTAHPHHYHHHQC